MKPLTPTTPENSPTEELSQQKQKRYFNQIGKTLSECADILKIHRSYVHYIEQKALNDVRAMMEMDNDNTHLLAHDPTIGEIDNLFLTQPWMMWLRLPPVEGSRIGRVISRGEWEKSKV